MSFTFIDLFAGIGGFHIALSDLGGKCVFASEIDEAARDIYRKNFEKDMKGPIVGDIIPLTEKVVSNLIPEHDVLAAGFPCQPFSKSGAQLGMDETRGTLFYNIAKILEKRKPRILILENVRNLTGPKHKHTWALILRVLRDLGYHVSDIPTILSPHLISPSDGGTPQVRDRVYIIGVFVGKQKAWKLSDEPFFFDRSRIGNWKPTDWSLSKHLLQADDEIESIELYKVSNERLKVIQIWEDFLISLGEKNGKRLPGFPLWEFAMIQKPKISKDMPDWKIDFLKKNSAFYIDNQKLIDTWRKKHQDILLLNNSYKKFEWQAQDMKSIWDGVIQFRPSGVRVKKPDYLPALVAMNQTSIIGKRKRTITVREAARLQAFPENFTFFDQNPSKSFKQLGNAVSVGTVKLVLSSVLENLDITLNTRD